MGEWILVGTLADFSPAPGHGEDGIQMMEVSPAQVLPPKPLWVPLALECLASCLLRHACRVG